MKKLTKYKKMVYMSLNNNDLEVEFEPVFEDKVDASSIFPKVKHLQGGYYNKYYYRCSLRGITLWINALAKHNSNDVYVFNFLKAIKV